MVKNIKIKNHSKLETVDLKSLETVSGDVEMEGLIKIKNIDMKKLKRVKNLKVINTTIRRLRLRIIRRGHRRY